MKAYLIAVVVSLSCLGHSALAQQKPLSGEFQKQLPAGSTLLAIGSNGRASVAVFTGKKFRVTPPTASARLYVLKGNKVVSQVVLSRCKNKKRSKTINVKSCEKSQVYTSFKAGKKLGTVATVGSAYVVRSASLASVIVADKATATDFAPVGLATLGLGGGGATIKESAPSDPNLTVSTNGLQDAKADTAAVNTNTYSFTVNVTSCLNSAPSGAISWPANNELYIDLQFRSKDGDNSAQKFCVKRAAS